MLDGGIEGDILIGGCGEDILLGGVGDDVFVGFMDLWIDDVKDVLDFLD